MLRAVPRPELAVAGVLTAAFAVAATALAAAPVVFGHDESVYALWARAWLHGGTDVGVGAHRAPLLPALGVAVLAVDSREVAFRLVGVAFGLAGLVGVWALGRAVGATLSAGRPAAAVGLLAAATFAFARPVLDAAGLFLTDLPAAALLVWAAVVCWHHLEVRGAPGPGLVAAPALAAAALYLRYGAALPVALLGVTVAVVWGRTLARHRAATAAAVAVFAVLLLPHAVNATVEFGAPWGRITHTAGLGAGERLGQGLREYAALVPFGLAGPLAEAVMLIGAFGGILRLAVAVARRDWSPTVRAWLLLAVPALANVGLSGLTAPGDPRFVLFPFALLSVAGWLALAEVFGRVATGPALAVVALVVGTAVAVTAVRDVTGRHAARDNHPVLLAAAAEIRARGHPSCSVLSAYGPRLTWYSGCPTYNFGYPPRSGREDALHGDHRFLLVLGGHRNQPEGALLDDYLALVDEPVARWNFGDGDLEKGELYELGGEGAAILAPPRGPPPRPPRRPEELLPPMTHDRTARQGVSRDP